MHLNSKKNDPLPAKKYALIFLPDLFISFWISPDYKHCRVNGTE